MNFLLIFKRHIIGRIHLKKKKRQFFPLVNIRNYVRLFNPNEHLFYYLFSCKKDITNIQTKSV